MQIDRKNTSGLNRSPEEKNFPKLRYFKARIFSGMERAMKKFELNSSKRKISIVKTGRFYVELYISIFLRDNFFQVPAFLNPVVDSDNEGDGCPFYCFKGILKVS